MRLVLLETPDGSPGLAVIGERLTELGLNSQKFIQILLIHPSDGRFESGTMHGRDFLWVIVRKSSFVSAQIDTIPVLRLLFFNLKRKNN